MRTGSARDGAVIETVGSARSIGDLATDLAWAAAFTTGAVALAIGAIGWRAT